MPPFMHGLELCRMFYHEAIRPILDDHFPGLEYAAALIGPGSEVLGFDTEMSTDHHWGPRGYLFFKDDATDDLLHHIDTVLRNTLPYTFAGYSTHFGDPNYGEGDNGTRLPQTIERGPVHHMIHLTRTVDFFQSYINLDIHKPMDAIDWLTLPQQKLRTITAGAVYHDGIGLQEIRERFAYYPQDVWRYLLAAGWDRIAEEEHLMPRAGYVGDELGSALIASRLVDSVMHLCFLMEKQYTPYAKWYGTAFKQLKCSVDLLPVLRQVQLAATWQDREPPMSAALEALAAMHNASGITEPIESKVSSFHGRPFMVIQGWRFQEALVEAIEDPEVKQIARKAIFGAIDQFSNNTSMKENPSLRPKLRELYI